MGVDPDVFNAMARKMLFLANAGVEMVRMDAVPFLWQEKGRLLHPSLGVRNAGYWSSLRR